MVASKEKTGVETKGTDLRERAPEPPRSRSTILGRLPKLLTQLDDRELLLVVAVTQKLAGSASSGFVDRLQLLVDMDPNRLSRDLSVPSSDGDLGAATPPGPRVSSPHRQQPSPSTGASRGPSIGVQPETANRSSAKSQPAAVWVHRNARASRSTPPPANDVSGHSSPSRMERRQTPPRHSGTHRARPEGGHTARHGRTARTLSDFLGEPVSVPAVPEELETAAKKVRSYGLELFYFPPTTFSLPAEAHFYSGAKYGTLYTRSTEGQWALMDMTRPSARNGGRYEHDALIGRTDAGRTTRFGLSFYAAEDAIRQIEEALRLQHFEARLLTPGEWILFANLTGVPFINTSKTAREWVAYSSRERGPAVGGVLDDGTVPYNLHKKTEAFRDVGFRFCVTL